MQKIMGFHLTTIQSKSALVILAWFAWHLLKPHIEGYMPPDAVTAISVGIPALGLMTLRDTLESFKKALAATPPPPAA